jgi:hypothetical protein
VVAAVALRRRDVAVLAPIAGFVAAFLGIALLAPVARVQPYYLTAALPLGAVALAAAAHAPAGGLQLGVRGDGARSHAGRALLGLLAAAVALVSVPRLHQARSLYMPDPNAFMADFARTIAARPEHHVITVAHYDATLLAYYLARAYDVPMDWQRLGLEGRTMRPAGTGKSIEVLAYAHALEDASERDAAEALRSARALGSVLVVERDEMRLSLVSEELDGCEPLLQAPGGRLVLCGATMSASASGWSETFIAGGRHAGVRRPQPAERGAQRRDRSRR